MGGFLMGGGYFGEFLVGLSSMLSGLFSLLFNFLGYWNFIILGIGGLY